MDYCWIDDIEQFKRISADWDSALISSEADNPFLLSDFLITWWKYYSKKLTLCFFLVYEDGKIIAGLPLCMSRNGYTEYPGGCVASYTEFLCVQDNQEAIWEIFLKALTERNDWRVVCLKRYNRNRLNVPFLHSLSRLNRSILLDSYRSEYTYIIDIPQNFSKYADSLNSTIRRYIRYSQREFQKMGNISLEHLEENVDLEEWCKKYLEFSISSFKSRNRQSAFCDKDYYLFFKDLIRKFYGLGYLDAYSLNVAGRIAAMHFGYSMKKNLNWFYPTFDVKFSKLHPGHLLLYKLVELGSQRGNKVIDLQSGYVLYKKQWSSRKEEIFTIEIRRNTIRNHIERAVLLGAGRSEFVKMLKRKMHTNILLEKLARKVKAIFKYNY